MRVLVGLTSFGLANERHLRKVVATYEAMSYDTNVVVFSNIPRDLGKRTQVVVGLPTHDPWSLGYAHRRYFIEHRNDYDIFIYAEDDIEILEPNIRFFIEQDVELAADEIPGLFRYELDRTGSACYPDVIGGYHWDPNSVRRRGRLVFAELTNLHSGCYVLSRSQLQHCLQSGGYTAEPQGGAYDLLCSAATDPYAKCGLRKIYCISHLDEILVHHLSDRYSTTNTKIRALPDPLLRVQIREMLRLDYAPSKNWIVSKTSWQLRDFTKRYYERPRKDVISLLGRGHRRHVLSVGCGSGDTERELLLQGNEVVAIPLDNVIASCARANGVSTLPPNPAEALEGICNDRFDCVLIIDVLQHYPDPVALIGSCIRVLADEGILVCSIPNLSCIAARRALAGMSPVFRNLRTFFDQHGSHPVTKRQAIRWFHQLGLKRKRAIPRYGDRVARMIPGCLLFGTQWLALGNTILFAKVTTQRKDNDAVKEHREVLEDSNGRNATFRSDLPRRDK